MKEKHKYLTMPLAIGITVTIVGAILGPLISYLIFPQGVEQFVESYRVIIPILIITGLAIVVVTLVVFVISDRRKKGGFFIGFTSDPPIGLDVHQINYRKHGVVWPISYRIDPIRGNLIYVNPPQCPNCMRDLRHEEKGRIQKTFVLKCGTCGSEYPAAESLSDMEDDVRDDFIARLRRQGYRV